MHLSKKTNTDLEEKKQKVDESEPKLEKLEEEIKQLKNREEELLYIVAEKKNEEIFSKKLNEANKERFREKIVKKILAIIDSLDIAIKYLDKSGNPEIRNHSVGFKMILKKIEEDFGEEGLKEIEVIPLKDKYNRIIHKATKVGENKKHPDGIVLKIEKRGYYFGKKVIREAEVEVNKIK